MSRELNTESRPANKQGKKTKAQRKAEWQTKYGDHSEAVLPKQIEIIKPAETSVREARAAAA
jgi:hypothetical protein